MNNEYLHNQYDETLDNELHDAIVYLKRALDVEMMVNISKTNKSDAIAMYITFAVAHAKRYTNFLQSIAQYNPHHDYKRYAAMIV